MGWAKYAEDNYDAFFERQAMKGGNEEIKNYSFSRVTTESIKLKEESNFSEMFSGESCFSF